MPLCVLPENFPLLCRTSFQEAGFRTSIQAIESKLKGLNVKIGRLANPKLPLLYFIQAELFHARFKTGMRTPEISNLKDYLGRKAELILKTHMEFEGPNQPFINIDQIKAIQKKLLDHPSQEGYRTQQVWMGPRFKKADQAFLVALPPEYIQSYMNDLVKFYNHASYNELLKIAIFYTQFLAIHPFQDANGRTARILVSRAFFNKGYFSHPVFSIAHLLENRQFEYMLQSHEVLLRDRWEPYLEFFLGLIEAAADDCDAFVDEILHVDDEVDRFLAKQSSGPKSGELFDLLYESTCSDRKALRMALNLDVIGLQRLLLPAINAHLITVQNNQVEFTPLALALWKRDWSTLSNEQLENQDHLPGLVPNDYDPLQGNHSRL